MSKQKDNSTLDAKLRLRRAVLKNAPPAPMVLETHGGNGRVYERAWYTASGGCVIEKDSGKIEQLAQQRPHWSVFEGDCIAALGAGLMSSTAFDVVDVDPYGSPLPIFDALFHVERTFPERWHLVVNDGMRQKLQRGGAWHVAELARIVARRGNNLAPVYLEVARELVEAFALRIGYQVAGWHGYYTGDKGLMTHYWAVLERISGAAAPASGCDNPPADTAAGPS
jgi:hypothetical protein